MLVEPNVKQNRLHPPYPHGSKVWQIPLRLIKSDSVLSPRAWALCISRVLALTPNSTSVRGRPENSRTPVPGTTTAQKCHETTVTVVQTPRSHVSEWSLTPTIPHKRGIPPIREDSLAWLHWNHHFYKLYHSILSQPTFDLLFFFFKLKVWKDKLYRTLVTSDF